MLPISAAAFHLSCFLFLIFLPALVSVWLIRRYLPPWTRPPSLALQCVLLHNWNNQFSRWRLSSEPPKIVLSELPFPAAAVSFVPWYDEEWEVSVSELHTVHWNPLSFTSATNGELLNTFVTLLWHLYFFFNVDCNWFCLAVVASYHR